MALLSLFVAGCDNWDAEASNEAHLRAAIEFACPLDQVTVTGLGEDTYCARGCTVEATFVCFEDNHGKPRCIREGGKCPGPITP